jgi:hypothetical protein
MQFQIQKQKSTSRSWLHACSILKTWALAGWFLWMALSVISWQAPQALGQAVPLADMVPLDELETTTDDLIRLATSYADAVRELKTYKITAETLQTLRPNAVISGLEVRIAQLNAQTAESKVLVLRMIVEKQLAAAQTKLEIVKRIDTIDARQGRDPEGAAQGKLRIAQAEATVSILKMILSIK